MIVKSKAICGGKPRVSGTRLTVSGILHALASGQSEVQLLSHARTAGIKLKKSDIKDVFIFSAKKLEK